jgi:hypothetical protein
VLTLTLDQRTASSCLPFILQENAPQLAELGVLAFFVARVSFLLFLRKTWYLLLLYYIFFHLYLECDGYANLPLQVVRPGALYLDSELVFSSAVQF